MNYYILYYPGSCGMFLTAVLGMSMGMVDNIEISNSGHCHDLGSGIYISTDYVNVVGWHWHRAQTNPTTLLNGHYTDLSQVKQDFPDCQVILIDVADAEIASMTNLRFYKTMNPMSQREHSKFIDKFNITDWPSYSSVVEQPELVKDSITEYDKQWFKEWQTEIDNSLVDVKIPFSDLFEPGFGNVKKLLGLNTDTRVQEFIEQYQIKNLNLYKL